MRLESPLSMENLTEWDILEELMVRLFFLSSLPEGVLVKDESYNPETDDWYDFFTINAPHNKPPKIQIQNELLEYKEDRSLEFLYFLNTEYYSIEPAIWTDVAKQFDLDPILITKQARQGMHIDAINLALKFQRIKTARNNMNTDIFTEMSIVFQTNDPLSAITFAESWKLKKEYAADYVGAGLYAIRNLAGFTIGQPLDTQQKIIDFYTAMVESLVEFDKFRDNRINQFLAEKAAIEAN